MKITLPLLFICLLLPGCGPGGLVGTDDTQFLDGLNFDKPVEYAVTSFDTSDQNNLSALAALGATGMLTEKPYPDFAPWWQFNPIQGAAPNQLPLVAVGTREVTSRSEERRWTENGVDFFAETVSYQIVPSETFQKIGMTPIGPFTFRLVAQNDPAVGHWQVQTASVSVVPDPDEQPLIQQQLVSLGQHHTGELQSGIAKAIDDANEIIAQNLASQGLLERDAHTTDVLFSRKNGMAYYVQQPTNSLTTISAMVAFCDKIRTPGYSPWRLPTVPEIRGILDQRGYFLDTPDRRLLGSIDTPTNGDSWAMIPSRTLYDFTYDSSNNYDLSNLPATFNNVALTGIQENSAGGTMDASLRFTEQPTGQDILQAEIDTHPVSFNIAQIRLLCVSPLKSN